MSLYDLNYEFTLKNALPANARDLVEHLYTTFSFAEMLALWQDQKPNNDLLKAYRVDRSDWRNVLQAALIAKLSYFEIHDQLSSRELLYLMKTACQIIDYPLDKYSLNEIIKSQKESLPTLCNWLFKIGQTIQIRQG